MSLPDPPPPPQSHLLADLLQRQDEARRASLESHVAAGCLGCELCWPAPIAGDVDAVVRALGEQPEGDRRRG
jgi:hypothetical protein